MLKSVYVVWDKKLRDVYAIHETYESARALALELSSTTFTDDYEVLERGLVTETHEVKFETATKGFFKRKLISITMCPHSKERYVGSAYCVHCEHFAGSSGHDAILCSHERG